MDSAQYQFIKKLHDNQTLLDILLSFEDYLDSLDLWAFKNWFDGTVIEGPNLEKYWVSITLEYPFKHMPDPTGGMRILKHGGKVTYQKANKERTDQEAVERTIRDTSTDQRPLPTEKIWLVNITIPRRYIEDVLDKDLATYDAELSAEHAETVADAKRQGINKTTPLTSDESDLTEPLAEPEAEE